MFCVCVFDSLLVEYSNNCFFVLKTIFCIAPCCCMLCVHVVVLLLSVPNAPGSLVQANKGTSYIEIRWNKPTGGVDSYELRYKKATDGNYPSSTTSIGKEQTTYQIDELNAGVTYDIQIRTVSKTESSSYALIRLQTGKYME